MPNRDKLALTRIRGNARAAGRAYGEAFEPLILGFLRQELRPDAKRLAYARKCWPHLERTSPTAAEFLRGEAEGSRLSLEQVTLMALHEEIYHVAHCTAFIATNSATRDGNTIVAQNWDWGPNTYPWPGLLKLDIRGARGGAAALYHYPGLWACAGVNEAGLSLMWTGGGYLPKVAPRVGVPTYALIAEIMTRRTVDEAIAYLRSIKRLAGCFLFFLGDAKGSAAIVEGANNRIEIDRSAELMHRANHYTCPSIVACSKQKLPAAGGRVTTIGREKRMREMTQSRRGKLTAADAKRILTDRTGPWPWLHQFPGGKFGYEAAGMTIDSLFAVCQDRALHTCRGGREPGPWQTIAL